MSNFYVFGGEQVSKKVLYEVHCARLWVHWVRVYNNDVIGMFFQDWQMSIGITCMKDQDFNVFQFFFCEHLVEV